MKEKRGNTVKLVYDFNSAGCCEVEFRPDKWVRTTPREFRSWGGKRRMLVVENTGHVFYEDYNGPVYYYETNFQVKNQNELGKRGLVFLDGIDNRKYLGQKRKHENFS